jgi:transcriptional regulator with XRE-family HTH domain
VATNQFGGLLKGFRLRAGFGLRKFAAMMEMKPSNLCDLEYGRRHPPEDQEKLIDLAETLGLVRGSEDWETFFDAARAPDQFPADVQHLASRAAVPALLRTIDDRRLSDHDIQRLIKEIEDRQGGDSATRQSAKVRGKSARRTGRPSVKKVLR